MTGKNQQKALPAPVHEPTEEMTEEEKEMLLRRQSQAATILQELQSLTRFIRPGGGLLG